MNFGEKLRELRQGRNLTQPELAESLGIEQSYLSKLETGKSLPSNEIFRTILEVFSLEVGDFVDDLDRVTRNRMRQIPDVSAHFNHQHTLILGDRRRWLLGSSALVAFGAALIFAGSVNVFGGEWVYSYRSPGIVLDGEPKEIFPPGCFGGPHNSPCDDEFRSRVDRVSLSTRDFRGDLFNLPVEGGSRTYYLQNTYQSEPPWQNKALGAFGMLLAAFGAIGIVLEKKLARFQ